MAEESLKHKTKRGIYWTFFNQFANNGLTFVVGIVLARLLSPSDYGIIALPSVFFGIACTLIDCGFGSALIRKPELSESDLSTAFYYSFGIGILSFVALFLCAPYIADFFNTPILIPLVRVSALTMLWSPLGTPQGIIMKRRLDFKTPARISIVTNILGACAGIIAAYLGYGLWSLVIMNLSQSLLDTVQRWIVIRWLPKASFSRESFRYLWNYGNKIMVSTFLDVSYRNITPLIIGKFYSPVDLGIYNRARGYAKLPSHQITSMVQQVTFPVLSKMQDNDEALAKNYRKMIRVTAFVEFPVMVMLSALARPLIILLVTEKWESSIILLQIMCFSAMWYPVHAMNLNLLQVKGRSDLFLRLEIIKKVISLIILLSSLPFGIICFVCAGIISSLLNLFVNTYYTGKLIQVSFLKQMGDLLPILLLSMGSWLSVYWFSCFVDNLWIQLLGGGIIGVCVYLIGSFIFRFRELSEVKYMLNKNA